jgi:hypothetical protein
MSWWDFLTLLFGPSPRQPATDEQPPETAAQINRAAAQPSRLRRAWRWMRATG